MWRWSVKFVAIIVARPAAAWGFGLTCSALVAAADIAPDLDYMARLMWEAESAARPYPDIARLNPALDDETLFAVQQRFVAHSLESGKEIGGFKGGFLPAGPIGGVLFKQGFIDAPAVIDSTSYVSLLIEAEIAFEFCAPVAAPLADIAALKKIVCKLRPAVELPDAAVHDLAILKADLARLRRALIPNNAATRQLLLGTARDAAGIDVNQLDVATSFESELIGTRSVKPQEDLWRHVLWIVNEFVLRRGYTIAPGLVIIPGNLTGLHPGKPGHYEVDYGALGVVKFEVTAEP